MGKKDTKATAIFVLEPHPADPAAVLLLWLGTAAGDIAIFPLTLPAPDAPAAPKAAATCGAHGGGGVAFSLKRARRARRRRRVPARRARRAGRAERRRRLAGPAGELPVRVAASETGPAGARERAASCRPWRNPTAACLAQGAPPTNFGRPKLPGAEPEG